MKVLLLFMCLFLIFNTSYGDDENGRRVFIVYMGGPISAPLNHPVDLLLSTIPRLREENAILHTYKEALSGFATRLSEEEAEELSKQPGVISVFPDKDSSAISSKPWGIWPESQSFDDRDMSAVPSKWKGICAEGVDFNSSHCNRKIVGARSYINPTSPRDTFGHGTHVASTAGGAPVFNASYYGLASGIARGGSPTSHIAVYRVCTEDGCPGSAILAGMDDAIADGVDVPSLSLGPDSNDPKRFSIDPIAIGAFHAVQKGLIVVCSAGNEGPSPKTVVNEAPWILTVAATTIDRAFESDKGAGLPRAIIGYKPAPVMFKYSSRGPSNNSKSILKPDVAAPGVSILAAWRGNDTDITPPGMQPPQYVMESGTSMACPHVSAVAARIKSKYPSWSPAAIRSAIMTTAMRFNNLKVPITTGEGKVATPYDLGAGELSPSRALDPGLVYDFDPTDYLKFLCFNGYNSSEIKRIQPSLPSAFSCPKDASPEKIWNINYPSISVQRDRAGALVLARRTLTHVAQEATSLYNVSVIAPIGLRVEVQPKSLMFTSTRAKLTYQVTFSSTSTKEDAFGFIVWSNGKHMVSTPYVVSA